MPKSDESPSMEVPKYLAFEVESWYVDRLQENHGRSSSVYHVGRNEPCPCGSGLKYKKCCLKIISDQSGELTSLDQTLATAYKKMADQEWNEALKLFQSLVDTAVNQTAVQESIGACYDGTEDYLRAAEHYEKALALCHDSKRFELTYRLGVSRGCAGRIEKAIGAFKDCKNLDPVLSDLWKIDPVIDVLEATEREELGRSYFFVQVQLQRAFTDMEEENYTSALARLESIRQVEPRNPVVLYNMGVALTFLKMEDRAYEVLEEAVSIEPDLAPAWYNMGQINLLKKEDYSKALNCFTKAIAARPDYIGAHFQSGVSWELLGDEDRAAACFEKTLELDPQNKPAQEKLQRIRESREKAPTAVSD
jgi:tetratricopeptide (TPR) repeat protein